MAMNQSLTDLSKEELIEMVHKLKKQKKYGLVWEDQPEYVEQMMKTHLPVLKEKADYKVLKDESLPHNLMIEGDNLHALTVLKKTHKGAVDVIYIDPPYNTGNKDFIYNDHFVDREDSWRHSSWLSFMDKRLRAARSLLTDEGVIFISIDDNEMAQLKLLCDEVFGEINFVTNLHVEMSATQGMKVKSAKKGNIVKNGEYVLVYSKKGKKSIVKNILYNTSEYDPHYSKFLVEQSAGKYRVQNLGASLPEDIRIELATLKIIRTKDDTLAGKRIPDAYRLSAKFKAFVEANTRNIVRAHDTIDGLSEDVLGVLEKDEAVLYSSASRDYLIGKNTNSYFQYIQLEDKFKLSNDFVPNYGPTNIRGDWWKGFYLDMGNVSKEGDVVFKNGKKPVRLIKQLIHMVSDKDATILDFFAGSGTTGHAVLELNKEDGGNRKFILCTNNEISEEKELDYLVQHHHLPTPPKSKNSKAYKEWFNDYKQFKTTQDYLDVTEQDDYQLLGIARSITYDRMYRVINGYTTSRGKIVESIPSNLHYYVTDFVDKRFLSLDNIELVERLDAYIAIKEGVYTFDKVGDITVISSLTKDVFLYPNDFVDKEDARVMAEHMNGDKEAIIYIQEENKVDKYINEMVATIKFVPADFFKGGELRAY